MSLFRYAWRPMLAAATMCLVPVYAVMTVVAAAFAPSINGWLAAAQQASLLGLAPPPLPAGSDVALISLIAAGILLLLGAMAAAAAIIWIVDQSYRAQPAGAVAAVRVALGRMPALAAAAIIYFLLAVLIVLVGVSAGGALIIGGGFATFLGLIVFVGTVAALLFVGMRTSLSSPAIVLERVGGAEGLARSWRLAAGSGWRVLGYLLLVGLLATLFGLLLTAVPVLLLRLSDTAPAHVFASTVIDGLVAILLAALSPVILTLLYYDLRWRRGESVPVPGGSETSAETLATQPSGPFGPTPPPGPPPGPPPL
jgi:hypothetical protein